MNAVSMQELLAFYTTRSYFKANFTRNPLHAAMAVPALVAG
jgi:hypothetical protein